MDEVNLVEAAQRGDLHAMSQLIDALSETVGRICGAIALADGPDAAQETFIQVFRDLPSLREPARLRPWVRRIAAREAIRHAKKGRRTTPMEGNHMPAVMPSPAEIGDVRAVLERLAPEQRAILVLRDLEGWSEEEAAAQLEIAIGTAKSRLSRARSAFKRRWR
jgi:RNA polymerase sigma-70 factor (ECF subfamily)